MRRSGRVSLVTVIALMAIAMVVVVLAFARVSVSTIGSQFMDALARSDVDTLTKMTYLGNETPEQIHKQWEYTTQVPGKNYNFNWRVVGDSQPSETSATVRVMVTRNLGNNGNYEENFALPLIKIGETWKVDVGGISHEMYPGLPRVR